MFDTVLEGKENNNVLAKSRLLFREIGDLYTMVGAVTPERVDFLGGLSSFYEPLDRYCRVR